MSRTGKVPKRKIAPDQIFSSILVARLINSVMRDGKKALAQRLVYGAFEKIKEQTHKNPESVFEEAVKRIAPKVEVRPRRVGGATYMVPMEVKSDRRSSLAVKWIVAAAKTRPAKDYLDGKLIMASKLAAEITAAATGEGEAYNRKIQIEKQAEANRAFAHFRW